MKTTALKLLVSLVSLVVSLSSCKKDETLIGDQLHSISKDYLSGDWITYKSISKETMETDSGDHTSITENIHASNYQEKWHFVDDSIIFTITILENDSLKYFSSNKGIYCIDKYCTLRFDYENQNSVKSKYETEEDVLILKFYQSEIVNGVKRWTETKKYIKRA